MSGDQQTKKQTRHEASQDPPQSFKVVVPVLRVEVCLLKLAHADEHLGSRTSRIKPRRPRHLPSVLSSV